MFFQTPKAEADAGEENPLTNEEQNESCLQCFTGYLKWVLENVFGCIEYICDYYDCCNPGDMNAIPYAHRTPSWHG